MKIPDFNNDNENFWITNAQFKYIFSDFYNSDKSKDKNKTSKIMWAIFFRIHPKSEFYNLADKDEIIRTKWIKDKNFKWVDYKVIENRFADVILSQAEKSLIAWDTTMTKRDEFIHDQDFTLDEYDEKGKVIKGTADQLDRMLANTSKLYSEYFKIKKELSEEDIKRGKGNKPMSMSDSNEI